MLRFDFSALGGTEGAASTSEKSDNSRVKGYKKMKMVTEDMIKESLLDQLKAQNKFTAYCVDLVETYMSFYRMKEGLEKDIEKSGIRTTVGTGNGHDKTIQNPSIEQSLKVANAMLAILKTLDLQQPTLAGSADDYL